MTIPKRPEHKPVKVRDDLWSYKYQNGGLHSNKIVCMWWHEKDMSRHEHAVAKALWEALEEIEQRGWMYEMYADLLFGQFAKDVMDRVKASGWQP